MDRLVRQDTEAKYGVTIVVAHDDINVALRHGDHVTMLKTATGRQRRAGETVMITAEHLAEVYRVRGRVGNVRRVNCRWWRWTA